LIIAEAGVNHNGDIELAKKLVEVASDSGADLVKFQTFKASDMATADVKKAEYQIKGSHESDTQYEMLKQLELSDSMHLELIDHCRSNNVGFLSTGFDLESVAFLRKIGQEIFKIPSGEITNLPLLRLIGEFNSKVILSTGMSSLLEIDNALRVLVQSGTDLKNITVLQCTSAYPTPLGEVNLRAMNTIKEKFGTKVGFSDHTLGIEASLAAVALGASVIEKHFTLNKNFDGPDHMMSLNPHELKEMILAIRNIELAMGDGIKKIMVSETENLTLSRKTVVAKRNISKGEAFSPSNITCKRAGSGISPMSWDLLIGRVSSRNYVENERIRLEELGTNRGETVKTN
jgi:N,N'-diacetyllegionaminate synthase